MNYKNMFKKKPKNKEKNNIYTAIEKKIVRAKEEGDLYFFIRIKDEEIDQVRRHFYNLNIDLSHQTDGIFYYKVSGYSLVD